MYKSLGSFAKRIRKKVRRARRLRRFHVGLIVSHPKAGRTWLRVMLDELGLPFECTHDGSGTDRPFERLAPGRKPVYRQKPVLFMLRDPRDTIVSYYFQRTLRSDRFKGDMAEFIRHPSYGVERLARFNLAWLQLGKDLPHFLPLTYEALKATPVAVMRSVVGFLGADLSDTELETVLLNNTFDKMRARERSGQYNERRIGLRRRASSHPDAFKVRRGKIGGFSDYLSADDIAYCEEILRQFDYWRRCERLLPEALPASAPSTEIAFRQSTVAP